MSSFLSQQALAEQLGVQPAALTNARKAERLVAGRPVAEWAVTGADGRLIGYKIPTEWEKPRAKPEPRRLPGLWADLFGPIHPWSTISLWGEPGTGKSYAALAFGADLAEAGREVLFVPVEEGVGRTLQIKLRNLEAASEQLAFFEWDGDLGPLQEQVRGGTDWLVVDSLTRIGESASGGWPSPAARQLIAWIEAQRAGALLVSQTTKTGQPKGRAHWPAEPEIEIEVTGRSWMRVRHNRFGPLGAEPVPFSEPARRT